MHRDARPIFASFDDAWAWFTGGGPVETAEEHRARFTQGRAQFITFQAPVESSEALSLVQAIHDAFDGVAEIAPQPPELLHVSVRGVGFQVLKRQHADDVRREDVGAIGERGARALKGIRPIEVSLGPVNVFPDALILEVHDGGRLAELRAMLRDAVAHDSLIDDAHYLPHCTIATFVEDALSDGARERIVELHTIQPVTLTVGRIDLVRWWFTGFDERASVELDTVRSYYLRG